MAKMATYHSLAKYVMFYHYLRNILQSTTFLELEFHKLEFGTLPVTVPRLGQGGPRTTLT